MIQAKLSSFYSCCVSVLQKANKMCKPSACLHQMIWCV